LRAQDWPLRSGGYGRCLDGCNQGQVGTTASAMAKHGHG